MNTKKVFVGAAAVLSLSALTLAGCGNNSSKEGSDSSSTQKASLPIAYNNKKASIKGGTLKIGMVSDSAFKGIFAPELSDSNYDAEVGQFALQPLFKCNNNYKFVKGGAADISFNNKDKTATIKINKKVKWSNGKPLTSKDVEFAYEIIANPKASGVRYTDSLKNIKGMEEYHKGKADTISGIEMKDEHTVVLHFKQMTPGMQTSGSGYIWENAEPYEYLKDVPFDKIESCDQVRKKPVTFGPYKFNKIVSGESAEFVPNPYYWGKKPSLDRITIQTVSTATAGAALKSKKYDIMFDEPTSVYGDNKKPKGYTMVGKPELAYSYMGFKVGKFDSKKGVNVENKNAKMNNKALRQAMAYAMNVQKVSDKFGYGLNTRATSLIPGVFKEYKNTELKGFPQDVAKANKLLDKAGYKKGKDGYRKTPDGKKLTINVAAMSGSANQEAIMKNYIQCWKKVGLRCKLTNGRLLDFNNFYDKVQADSKDIDVFFGAWSLSSEPSPADLYSEAAPFNMTRFVSKKNTQYLKNIDSQKAVTDHKWRVKQFKEWQAWMNDQAYVVPLQDYYDVVPVKDNVKGFTEQTSKGYTLWENISLTK